MISTNAQSNVYAKMEVLNKLKVDITVFMLFNEA